MPLSLSLIHISDAQVVQRADRDILPTDLLVDLDHEASTIERRNGQQVRKTERDRDDRRKREQADEARFEGRFRKDRDAHDGRGVRNGIGRRRRVEQA